MEKGWRGAVAVEIGIKQVEEMTDIVSHHRKLQAWLFMSLSSGHLSDRLSVLLQQTDLLEDWFYPWAALRQGDLTTSLVEEISKARTPVVNDEFEQQVSPLNKAFVG